jgi:hypothetical protein
MVEIHLYGDHGNAPRLYPIGDICLPWNLSREPSSRCLHGLEFQVMR